MNTWTKRDGTKINIEDMTTSHIKNTIRMLERNVEGYKSKMLLRLAFYYDDVLSDHALDAINHEESMIERMDDETFLSTFTQYGTLKEELIRREDA